MALPVREYVLDTGLQAALGKAKAIRSVVQTAKTAIDAGPSTSADQIMNLMNGIKTSRDIFTQVAALPGLLAYARNEYADATLDMPAELTAVATACDNCLSWIATNFPKDANGWLLKDKIVNGVIEPRTFTPAALSGFSTQLGSLLAAFS